MSAGASIQEALFEVAPKVVPNEKDQRFTLRETDEWARKVAKVSQWHLDVAACEESHLADRYFTVETDGLAQDWDAPFVWCNPPYSDIAPWVRKAWLEMSKPKGPHVVAMLIPATRTEQPWWQESVEKHRDRVTSGPRLTTHFLPGRTSFGMPGNRDGNGVGSPPFTCVLLVWRRA